MTTPSNNPLIQKASVIFTNLVFNKWFQDNLPNYSYKKTSDYRSPEHNKNVGGVSDSAHLYGLAVDFYITDKSGKFVGQAKQSELFNQYIKSTWPGYSLDEKNHIHVNLDRSLQKSKIALIVLGLGAIASLLIYKSLIKGR